MSIRSMSRFGSIIIAIGVAAMAFTGCNDQQPQQVQQYVPQQQYAASDVPQQYQPQVVQQAAAPQEDHTIRDGLIGAAAGYMLGRHTAGSGNGNQGAGYHPPPVVHNTTVVKKVYVQQDVKQFNRLPVSTTPRSYRPSFTSSKRR